MKRFLNKAFVMLMVFAFIMSTVPQGSLTALAAPIDPPQQTNQGAITSGSTVSPVNTQTPIPNPTMVPTATDASNGASVTSVDSSATDVQSIQSDSSLSADSLQDVAGTEDVSKRTEFFKNYVLANGLREYEVFSEPINYKDSNGKYQPIDNSLQLITDTDGHQKYKNKANGFSVLIGANNTNDWNVELSKGSYSISWKMLGNINSQTGSQKSMLTTNQWSKQKESQKRHSVPNLSSEVDFANAMDNINLQYQLESNYVKQNLVLSQFTDISTLSEKIMLKGLSAVPQRDGSIAFVDSNTEQQVFLMPAPYMYDSQGNTSDITAIITQTGNNYTLTYSLDTAWLKTAVYPVTIDPSVTAPNGPTDVEDTKVVELYPTSNYYAQSTFATGYTSTGHKIYSLVKFDALPNINPSQIYLANFEAVTDYSSSASTVGLYEITSPWTSSSVTWNTRPSIGSLNSTYDISGDINQVARWNITNITKHWYTSTSNNNGLLLKTTVDTGAYMLWYSSDASYNRPVLGIAYDNTAPTAPTGLTTSPVATSTWTNNATPKLTWSGITDADGSLLANVQYQINGGAWTNTNVTDGTVGYTLPSGVLASSGTYTIKVRGVDGVGNAGSAGTVSATYKLDKDGPLAPTSVSTVPIASSAWTSNSTPKITWSGITDQGGSVVANVQYQINGGTWTDTHVTDGTVGYTLPSGLLTTSGTYTIKLRGVDGVGNIGSSGTVSASYELDIDPPTAPSIAIAPTNYGNAHPVLSWSNATDANSGVASVDYRVDGVNWVGTGSSSSSGSITLTLSEGVHSIVMRTVDKVGLSTSSSPLNYTCDVTAPYVSITSPTMAMTGSTSVVGTASDTNLNNWTLSYGQCKDPSSSGYTTINSGTTSVSGGTLGTFDTSGKTDDTYTLKITATDKVNLSTNVSQQVTVENSATANLRTGILNYWTYVPVSIGTGSGQVNSISGNLNYQVTDFNDSDTPMPLSLSRTYNSAATMISPMGKGWTWNYNIYLIREYSANQEVSMILKDGTGAYHRFVRNSDGTYQKPVGEYMTLTLSSGIYTVTYKSGEKMIFNSNGKLATIKDRNNNTVTLNYDMRGNLTTIANNFGQSLTFAYTVNGLTLSNGCKYDCVSTVTDAYGRVYHFAYDTQNGYLQQVYIVAQDNNNNAYNNGETYAYNAQNLLSSVTDPAGNADALGYDGSNRLQTLTNPLNEVQTLAYNANQTTTSTFRGAITTYGCNTTGQQTSHTDALGNVTSYTYDTNNFNKLTESYTNKLGYNADGSAVTANITEQWTYDTNGNVLTDIADTADAPGTTTTYSGYNSFGKPGSVQKPFERDSQNIVTYVTTTYTYDSNGNVMTESDPLGHSTTYTYDPNGDGNVLTITDTIQVQGGDPIIAETTKTYDDQGRLATITDPKGGMTSQGYTATSYGNVAWTEDANNNTTSYTYNILGQRVQVLQPGETNGTTTSYDNDGNVLVSITDDGVTTTNAYDRLGRNIHSTTQNGTTVQQTAYISYYVDTINKTETTISTDQNNAVTTTVKDANGQTISQTGAGVTTITEYNLEGDDIKSISSGVTTLTLYDRLGRVIQTVTDPTSKDIVNSTQYDLASNVLQQTDPNGYTTTNTYDLLNRVLISTQVKNGQHVTQNYTYDLADSSGLQVSRATDGKGQAVEYLFDKNGNIVKETDKGNTNTPVNQYKVIQYTYDPNGNLTDKTAQDGSVTHYTYTNQNKVQDTFYGFISGTNYQIKVHCDYDSMGNLQTQTQTQGSVTTINNIHYDTFNRKDGVSLNGTNVIGYDYNDNGTLKDMLYPETDGSTRTIKYTYDTQGRLDSIFDASTTSAKIIRSYFYRVDGKLDFVMEYPNYLTGDTSTYTKQQVSYDTAGRLVGVAYTDQNGDPEESYTLTLDSAARVLSEDTVTYYGSKLDTLKTYNYDSLSELTSEMDTITTYTKVSGQWVANTPSTSTTTYTYDLAGNRSSMTKGGDTWTYDNNEFNQLLHIYKNGTLTTSYTYDARGNQNTKTEGIVVTTYNYNVADRLISVTQNGSTLETNNYDGSGQRTSSAQNGTTQQYYYDGLTLLYTQQAGLSTRGEEYILDADSTPFATERFSGNYAGQTFYLRKDHQGSITNIVNNNSNVVKGYTYDAYGNQQETGNEDFDNSISYDGSVTDAATSLIYLSSRYYDPSTGIFISQDSYRGDEKSVWSLYGYCNDDPINNVDISGKSSGGGGGGGGGGSWGKSAIYNVPLYSQGDTNLCWAYSQVMIESYQKGKTLTQKQADARAKEIAISVNGKTDWNEGGWPTNISGSGNKVANITALYDLVKKGPVYGYYVNDKKTNAHLIVVTGVDVDKNIVYTNNPWGVKGKQSFSDFKKGVAKHWWQDGQGLKFESIYKIK